MGPTIGEDHILYDRTRGHTQQEYVRKGIEASTEYLRWSSLSVCRNNNGTDSASTQGIEGRVCAHDTWPSHVCGGLVAAQWRVGLEW